ncbi:MAG: DoxX family membrane protein [Candidatus Giovannonibacteria bacterium]|nr:DoxX family membrane protein [Candidatus Giovannonibacteria bacterium]
MAQFQKISLFLLRVSLGWLIFYAGIDALTTPGWSAAGYLKGAKTFVGFYQWLLQPSILPTINFVNEWALTLLGVSLILGVFIKFSAPLGALLMLLYYFPILQFPYPSAHSFIVDEHIIYAVALLVLASLRSGDVWGLGKKFG